MAKRLMCIVLSLLMIMSILPAGVVADDQNSLPTSGTVSSGTYTLTSDVTLTGMLTVESGSTVIIDLNGYTISYTSDAGISASNGDTTRMIYNYGSLTITDSSADGSGKISMSATYTSTSTSSSAVYACIVETTGALYLKGGTLELISVYKQARGIVVLGSGSVTVDGGNLSVTSKSSRQACYGIYAGSGEAKVSVTSGSVKAECTNDANHYSVYALYGSTDGCEVSVSGGTIKASGYSVTTNSYSSSSVNGIYGFSTTTVSGGEITVKNNSEESSSNAYGVRGKSDSYATITGGTISVTSAGDNGTGYAAGNATISGGTITADSLLTTVTVTGGSYSFDVTSVLEDGYSATQNSSGYYVVSITSTGVAVNTSTNTTYSTLQSAIDAANSGETVQLLTDISDESTITVDYTKSLTLDLAGYTLDGSITITGGDLTLKDSSEDGTGTVMGGVTVNAKVVFDGDVFLYNGELYKEYSEGYKDYSGLGLAGTGSFTMNGGKISGGVTVSNNSSFTMTGGVISNGSGRGVTLDNAGQSSQVFTVVFADDDTIYSITENTNITDNLANYFTMTGGTITDCSKTTSFGGGVYVGSYCIFTMEGGTITGNSASAGGGVYVGSSSTFTMTGGAIYGNTATSYASDIYTGYGTATIIAASSMTGLSGYAWYTDESGDRYSESNITTEITATTFVGDCISLIAVVPAATPTLYGRTLTLDGAVGVTFYFDMGELNADDYTLTAVIDSGGLERTISGITYTNTKTIGDKTYYRYTVYVNANEFNVDIDATLYYQGTSKVATYTTYRVATYCTKAIENDWAEKALCEALMCYGNYAVDYFASSGLKYSISDHDFTWTDPVEAWSFELSEIDTDAKTSGVKPDCIGKISTSLNMSATDGVGNWLSGSAISMNFYIEASSGIDGITFKINDVDVEAKSTSSDDLYCVSVQIPASEMSSTDGYTLSISDGTNTFKVTYSVYQYIAYTLAQDVSSIDDEGEKNELQKRQALVKAMYYFSEAASSYSNWY